MRPLLVAASALALSAPVGACGGEEPGGGPDAGEQPADAAPSADAYVNLGVPGNLIGPHEMTYYWLASEAEHPGPNVEALYTSECSTIATVSSDFADALRLEGSGRLSDGRVLNYWGACGCANSPCFFEVDAAAPWGLGVQSLPLRPFRSIAVNTSDFSIGQSIYVEELDGLDMPGDPDYGQFRHDGCVTATDIGGGIGTGHIDFFAGLREHYLTLDALVGAETVTIYAGGERCPDAQ